MQNGATGIGNVAVGFQALKNNYTDNNIAIGYNSLTANTIGNQNTAIGYQSLYSNVVGNQNVAIGYNAMQNGATGIGNVAVGVQSLQNNTTDNNTAVGIYSLQANTTGQLNVAMGPISLASNTTGAYNTSIGAYSSRFNNGYYNTTLGFSAMSSATGTSNSTAIGYNSLLNSGSSTNNTAIGYNTAQYTPMGNNNTFLGAFTDATANVSNSTAIGYNAKVSGSNQIVLGTSSETTIISGPLQTNGANIVNYNPSILTSTSMIGYQNTVTSTTAVSNGGTNTSLINSTSGISLTAGVWFCEGYNQYGYTTASHNRVLSISVGSIGIDTARQVQSTFTVANWGNQLEVTSVVSLTSTTNVYLVGQIGAGAGGTVSNSVNVFRYTRIA